MRYNSVLDLHTHTVVSGHAYCSLREMAKAASEKGLEVLGITEHAPAMPGTCHKYYFENLKIVPREMYGIQLLLGSEVNILDAQGTVDLAQRTLERMDVVIASLHMPCMKPGSKLENTESYLNVMKNPYVNIIGHPDDGKYEFDYEALVQGAKEYGKVLELNNHSLDPDCNRENAVENDTVMLNLCKKYQVPVVMDGFISCVAALIAMKLCPTAGDYILASHVSKEPAAHLILESMGKEAILHADMCLGEGTGAVALFPILDLAAAVYHSMSTFDDIHVEQYEELK